MTSSKRLRVRLERSGQQTSGGGSGWRAGGGAPPVGACAVWPCPRCPPTTRVSVTYRLKTSDFSHLGLDPARLNCLGI